MAYGVPSNRTGRTNDQSLEPAQPRDERVGEAEPEKRLALLRRDRTTRQDGDRRRHARPCRAMPFHGLAERADEPVAALGTVSMKRGLRDVSCRTLRRTEMLRARLDSSTYPSGHMALSRSSLLTR